MEKQRSTQQFRLAFATTILAGALAYLATRQFFIEIFGQFETWLLIVIAVSATCSFVYLYFLAIEAKYYKSRFFRRLKAEDKQVFFDLSVDVFMLVPAFFLFYYLFAKISSLIPFDLGSATWIASTLTLLLLIIVIPLSIRFIVWALTHLFYETKKSSIPDLAPHEDKVINLVALSFLIVLILPFMEGSATESLRIPIGLLLGIMSLGYLIHLALKHANKEKDI